MAQAPHCAGYIQINLRDRDRGGPRLGHHLVLEAFVGPQPDGMETRHLNNVRNDNRLSNLLWGTSSENNYDIVKAGRNRNANKTHCPRGHELASWNVAPSNLRRGTRLCRSCNRARAHVAYHTAHKPYFEQIADAFYDWSMRVERETHEQDEDHYPRH